MSRILLPLLAALALSACSDDAGPAAPASTSAAAQSVSAPGSADRPAPDTGPSVQDVALTTSGADLANGQRQFRRCQSCHTLNEGGRHTVGPNLHDVIDHPAASAAGFSYSRALRESGLVWDLETLDAWIENPRELVPGNRMSFVGLRNAEDRRDVIAYMAATTAQTGSWSHPYAIRPPRFRGQPKTVICVARIRAPRAGPNPDSRRKTIVPGHASGAPAASPG